MKIFFAGLYRRLNKLAASHLRYLAGFEEVALDVAEANVLGQRVNSAHARRHIILLGHFPRFLVINQLRALAEQPVLVVRGAVRHMRARQALLMLMDSAVVLQLLSILHFIDDGNVVGASVSEPRHLSNIMHARDGFTDALAVHRRLLSVVFMRVIARQRHLILLVHGAYARASLTLGLAALQVTHLEALSFQIVVHEASLISRRWRHELFARFGAANGRRLELGLGSHSLRHLVFNARLVKVDTGHRNTPTLFRWLGIFRSQLTAFLLWQTLVAIVEAMRV